MKTQKRNKRYLLMSVALSGAASACGAASDTGTSDRDGAGSAAGTSGAGASGASSSGAVDDANPSPGPPLQGIAPAAAPGSPATGGALVGVNEPFIGLAEDPDYGEPTPQPAPSVFIGDTAEPEYDGPTDGGVRPIQR